MKSLVRIVASVLFAAASLAAAQTNPILPHPDPFITLEPVNGEYLLLATTGKNITIWHGPTVAAAAKRKTVVFEPTDGMTKMWSPTIWKFGPHWWIYFAAGYNDGKGQHVYALESDTGDALGKYTFRGMIDLDNRRSIDPSLLHLNGKTYLMYVTVDHGENDIYMTELAAPMKPVGKKVWIAQPDQPWEKGVVHNNYGVVEGPTELHHDGKTFIVYSGSNTMSWNYCLGLLTYTSGDPLDRKSWKKSGPVFKSKEENSIYSTGRGTFAKQGDDWWLVYHAKTTNAVTMAGRAIRAQKFTWNKDGSPNFGEPVKDGPIR